MHLMFSKASSRTSCVDIMTRKGNDGQVGNSHTCATGYILCVEKTGSKLFYQFRPQGFLKMVDDRIDSVHDICSRLLCQSIAINERFCVVIDWSSIDRYQLIPINWFYWLILIDRLVFRSSISIDWTPQIFCRGEACLPVVRARGSRAFNVNGTNF